MRHTREQGRGAGVQPPRRSPLVVLLATLILTVTACQPLYIPPVPAPLELPERYEIDASARLDEGRPLLIIELGNVVEPAWLAIQWFAPNNREVASESIWITPADEGGTLSRGLPADVEVTSGRWRAILSVAERVVRQLSVEVP